MLKTFAPAYPGPGVIRQVLSDAPELMVVSFRFETGAEGAGGWGATLVWLRRPPSGSEPTV